MTSPAVLPSDALVAGRYRVRSTLGRGGAGTAYRVFDGLRGHEVALKLLDAQGRSEDRMRQELRLLRGLVHPNLVRLRDVGRLDGRLFYTADLVDGPGLGDVTEPTAAMQALVGVAEALRWLHASGIRHGDVKPDNVMLRPSGDGVLIDFSCAAPFGIPEEVSGTPGYLAPELRAGRSTEGAADVFGFGVTLERVTERLALPDALRQLGRACRAEDPAQRPSLRDLIAALGGEPTPTASPYLEPTRLLGRQASLRELRAWLTTPRRPGLLVVGEPGVGKTRWLAEAKWLAAAHHRVVEGDARDPEGVAAMLRRAVDDPSLPNDPLAALMAAERLGDDLPLLFLDDAHLAAPSQRRILDAWLRATPSGPSFLGTSLTAEGWSEDATRLPLEPLGLDDVARWVEGRLGHDRAADVLRLTGGYPASIAALMRAMSWRDWAAADLDDVAEQLENDELDPRLDTPTRDALVVVAASRAPLDTELLLTLGISADGLTRAAHDGWLTSDDEGWRLTRRQSAKTWLGSLDEEHRRALHRRLAERLAHRGPAYAIEATRQAALAGDDATVAERLAGDDVAKRPDDWVSVARLVVASSEDHELTHAAATILERAGRVDECLSAVARGLRRRPPRPERFRRLAAAAYLRAGRLDRAQTCVDRVTELGDADERAETLDVASRIALKRGDYDLAARRARAGLELVDDGPRAADLHDDLGLAASYLGDDGTARHHLDRAAALHASSGRGRARARSASYRAFVDYRAGDTSAAVEGYRRALGLAEACGASDLLVYAAQNLGAAAHQSGDLGEAAASYERGSRLATALGDAATEATLRMNHAKLLGDLGLFDRALSAARRAQARASEIGLSLIEASAMAVLGEIHLWRERPAEAIAAFAKARDAFGDESPRELVETELHLCTAQHLAGDHAQAARHLDEAQARIAALGDVDDLLARVALARGRGHLHADAIADAVATFEVAVERAEAAGQRELAAESHAMLSRACRRRGAITLAERHATAARTIWERTALGLAPEQSAAFWGHPLRREVAAAQEPEASPRTAQLERLLQINKRLSSSLDVDTVLTLAIDSALELTGAERGFVILAGDEDALELAVARNIDPSSAEDATIFSQGIARRVIAEGAPVITVDAESDARFEEQRSVHAMRLKSVVGVPIIARAGIIGAVYLDHRYRRGMFGPEEVQLLGAFADQVAIALTNARLHEQLVERTRELDELSRGQAARIDDLTHRVRRQQEVLQTRYDYRNVIGSSAAMRQVFRVLDRVIATEVPVLVQGESGTGKELIAKAIHYNGARKEGPLVSINCGALPDNLLESELFGYVKGAFTGATGSRDGLFVAAKGGTIFLDEIGEMPLSMQVKLLRVLQEREVTPLGTARAEPIDVRVVAASNRRLREEAEAGRFREDLYYRLGVVEVWVPPLRERDGDLPLLVQALLRAAAERTGMPLPQVSAPAMRALLEHRWPGNVRELENVLTKALLLAEGGSVEVDDLGLTAPKPRRARTRAEHEQGEEERLRDTLQATGWNVSETARRLGVSRPTIYRWMKRHGLDEV